MAIAIYIEYPRISAVQITGSKRHPRIKSVWVGTMADARNEDGTPVADRQAWLNVQVGEFVKQNKLGGKVYLVVGPEGMRYRDIHLAFTDKRQIGRVLPFQVEAVIPNVPVEDMALGYNVLRSEGESSHLLVHAADKEYVRSRITALEAAGLAVEGADSHLSGTMNLGLMHPELGADKPPALWLDFAGTIATVSEVHEGEEYAARVFLSPYLSGAHGGTAGAEDAKEAARKAQLEAEARAREFAGSTDSVKLPEAESVNIGEQEVAERIKHMSRDELLKFLNRVAVEARRTILMSNPIAEPTRLVVSGLGGAGEQLAQLLGNELAITDCIAIDLLHTINTGKDGKADVTLPDAGEMSYLAGVALKGVGPDYTQINFRYGDLAPGTLFDYAKTPLAFTATLVLLFSGILFLMSWTHKRQYERGIFDLRDREQGPEYFFKKAYAYAPTDKTKFDKDQEKNRSYSVIEDDPAQEITNAHKKLQEHQKFLMGETTDNYLRPHRADQILVEVFKAIQAAGPSYDFTLLNLNISGTSVTVDFFSSLTEDQKERDKMVKDKKLAPEFKDLAEVDRVLAAFRALATAHPNWFDGDPRQDPPGKPVDGPQGRQARQVKITLTLKKPTPPKTTAAPKGEKK
ncbi:MAG: hypothetical protein IT464_05740 [Planctomycetes bacterium]|nr:hypothetical protein [Planctomycetota bacterium]